MQALLIESYVAESPDSLVNCKFSGYALGFDYHARFVSAITGIDFNITRLLEIGERIYNLERVFNVGAGFSNAEDKLPERFETTPFKEGLSKDRVVPVNEMLVGYYRVRGWDENGIPTKKKLEELGLE